MIQTLTLNGGIDKDTNPLYLPEGSVLSRKNCRVASFDGGRVGINVSLKGMQEINASLPSGTNRVIGQVEDAERDQLVFANYNSNGNHGIYKLKKDTVTLLSQGSFWNFNQTKPVSMDILGDYLYLTDGYNPPRKMNIVDLITLDSVKSQLAVTPPSDRPTVALGSDDSRVVNKLVGKTFQFAYMYIYDDYTYSVLSPYSEVVVSSSVFSTENNTYENDYIGNFVNVGYDVGADNVRTVRLLAREGNSGSWFVVSDYDKNGEAPYESISYSFFNDAARQGLVETNAQLLYSDVPRLANSLSVAQNRLTLGGVRKGYNKADADPLINYDVVFEDAVLTPTVINLTNTSGYVGSYVYVEFDVPAHADLNEGDIISASFKGYYFGGNGSDILTDFAFEYSFSYRITASDIASGDAQARVQNVFSSDITSKGRSIVTAYSKILGVHYPNAYFYVQGAIPSGKVQIVFAGTRDDTWTYNKLQMYTKSTSQTTPAQGVSTHKAGSYKNVGILFYDKFNRTAGITAPQKVYVPFNGERDYADVDKKAKINFSITNSSVGVPDWAEYYRFAITESINFAGVYPFVTGNNTNKDAYLTYLDGHWVIALQMPTNLQYEFVKGDYVLLEEDSGSAISTIRKNIIGTRTLIEVSGEEKAGFWLILPKGDEELSDYEAQFITIYREKSIVEDLVYYESSATFSIVDGEMQTLEGDVGGEDAWFTLRKFEWEGITQTPRVEDFYINVDDGVRAYSQGRPVVEIDLATSGEIDLQDVVWSEAYLDNTKINGISMFLPKNRVQLDEKDGVTRRLILVGDVLKAIQDNKETSLYIGKEQITNANGSLQLVKTGNFIGTVYPSVDDYGSRYHDSIAKNNRNLYYWDGDKGEVVRSSPNGQIAISNYGMRSEFQRIADDIKSASSVRVVSGFDEKHNDLIITFSIDGVNQSLVFREGDNSWINDNIEYENANGKAPDLYGSIGNQLYSFLDNAWKHEATIAYNTFYGDSKALSVRGCLNVSPTTQKAIKSLKIDSNRTPNVIIETPVTNTRTLGQKTVLYPATFRSRLGEFVSAVFKNILTVSGEDLTQIHKGDDMVGFYIELEFTDDGTTEFQLRTVDVNFTVNQ